MEKPDQRIAPKSVRIAVKDECANWQGHGPGGNDNTCFAFGREKDEKCRIFAGLPCIYFEKCVLPLERLAGVRADYEKFAKECNECVKNATL